MIGHTAGLRNHFCSGGGNVASMTGLSKLTSAVAEAARHAARDEWGGRPRLYALAVKSDLESSGGSLPRPVAAAPEEALVPIEQEALPPGPPAEALSGIGWPASVAGCILVSELVIGADQDDVGGQQPVRRQGRLTVGVLRDGEHACCLQLRGSDELIVRPDLANDLVTLLLGTLDAPSPD